MTRLPYADPDRLPDRAREALDGMPPLGVFRMMANAETAFRPWARWGGVLLSELALDPLLRELAILRVSRLTPHAEYEWVQHEPIARGVGATDDQVAALERDDVEAGCFSDAERTVLRFTTEFVLDARVSDQTFEAAKALLSAREMVELMMVIGQYSMLARVMATTELDLDEPMGPLDS
ncbi:MAG TPA: carboxymuconolactone decarboxylase family protein [Thermoleophilaceae bacterium]|nr:carboxymuconolactone decarboxylase family protein [Thermoleophilaceae bacterium]